MIQEARIYSLANVGGQAVLVLEEVNGPRLFVGTGKTVPERRCLLLDRSPRFALAE